MRYLLLIATLAACSEFEPVERDACGNGLLEAGEDCDSSDPSCVSCSVACTTAADCPTTGYTCGVDGLCHAPGGALGQPRHAGTFSADELTVSDIDHDGIGDAVGLTRTSLIIGYGNDIAQLDETESFVTPTQSGPASFGDIDGDGSLDVTLSTPDGLVSFTSEYDVLAPVAVNERVVDPNNGSVLDIRNMFYVAPNILTTFVNDPQSGAAVIVLLDSSGDNDPPLPAQFILPCAGRIGAISAAELAAADFTIYNVNQRDNKTLDTVLSLAVGSGTTRRLCILALHREPSNFFNVNTPFTIVDITPATYGAPTAAPVLADLDLDADPCPGVVNPNAGLAALSYWEGELQADGCKILPVSTGFPQNPRTLQQLPAPPGSKLVGRTPVEPKVFGVTADALVTNEGVYPYVLGFFFYGVYHTTRKISQFGHGDLDGDGAVDLVIASAGESDLDMLFRVKSDAGFNLVRLDTASSVTKLVIGDYDGNYIADIAYTEQLEDHERLMVAFGTPDRPLEPRNVGVFASVDEIVRVGFPDSVDYLSVAEDLIVFQPALVSGGERRVTSLHGSPQRTLLSYFDPRPGSVKSTTLFRGAIIGDFTSDAGATQYTDVVGIAPHAASARNVADKTVVQAWRLPGTATGLDGTQSAGVTLRGVADCTIGDTSTLCLDLARYIAFPTAPRHDVVIGVDAKRRAVMFDPWATGMTVMSTSLGVLNAAIPDRTVPRTLHAADLDGDGTHELVAAFAPVLASGASGAILVCSMQGGVPQTCEDLMTPIKDAAIAAGISVTQCYDATVAKLSYGHRDVEPDNRLDIVAACRGEGGTSLFRVHRGVDGNVIERIALVAGVVTGLRAGDVTGDQIDDLVVLEGEASTSLLVFPQCTSRDLACMKGDQ